MTTITVDRAVLEQALEAMKKITAHPKNFWDLEEEIAALSTALAEQQQKPVAWQWLNTAHFRKNLPANAESGAWNPLYTHPPRREWQSLTDDEINAVAAELGYAQLTPREVARAAIARTEGEQK